MKLKYFSLFLIFLFAVQLSAQDEKTNEEIKEEARELAENYLGEKSMKRIETDFGTMGFGFASYLADGSFKMPTMYNTLDQKFWRSGNFYIDAVSVGLGLMPKGKIQKLRLLTGIRYSLFDYHFERAIVLIEDAPTWLDAVTVADKEVKKSRLHVHSLQIPLMLRFQSKPESMDKSINFAIGYVHSMRFASNFKVKYEDKEKLKVRDDFNLNPSIGMLEARVGFGQFNFYVQYGLDPLFTEGAGPMVAPINIGVTSK